MTTATLMLTLLMSSASFAQNSGNGTKTWVNTPSKDSTSTPKLALKTEAKKINLKNDSKKIETKRIVVPGLQTRAHEGGSNIGGSDDNIRIVTEWCDSVVDDLKTHEITAVQKYADGSAALAVDVYKQGLRSILEGAQQNSMDRLSWTYKTAERGLQLAERLTQDQAPVDAQIDVLRYYYQMVEDHYYSLDARYYIPLYHGGPSVNYDVHAFEGRLQIYASELLSWFEQKMIQKSNDGSVTPAYSDRVFFMTLATVAKGLSEDLGPNTQSADPSLFPTRYAQVARTLKRVANQMENVLAGNGSYSNQPRAVQDGYRDLKRIQEELKK
jgi:hypothetical protein